MLFTTSVVTSLLVVTSMAYVPPIPTQAHPRFLWDATMATNLASLKNAAAGTYTNDVYSWMDRHSDDNENWVTGYIPCIMYKITGDTKYAGYAWNLLRDQYIAIAGSTTDGNFLRRWGTRAAMIYDWIYETLTPSQKSSFFSALNGALDRITSTNADGTPRYLRDADTDEIIGWYLHLVLAYAATGDENPHPGQLLLNTAWIGGLHPTKSYDLSTIRNEWFALMTWLGRGGAWPESVYYDGGTMANLMLGWAMARTAFQAEHFPEAPPFFSELGRFWLALNTPDQKALYLWGDEGESGQCRDWSYRGATSVAIQLMVSAVADDPSIRNQAFSYFKFQYESGTFTGTWLPDEALFFWKDVGTREDYKALQPKSTFSPSAAGVGIYKTGWSTSDTLFGFDFPSAFWLDHMTCYSGNFQVWRHGEWVLPCPASYGGPTTTGQGGSNTLLLSGFPLSTAPEGWQAKEAKEVIGFSSGDDHMFVQGIHAGSWNGDGNWYVPPTVQHEHTRSFLFLPGVAKSHDTLVIYDRMHVLDPRNDPAYTAQYTYSAEEKQAIEAMFGRKVWFVHSPTSPTVGSTTVSWTTPGGQSVRLTSLQACRISSPVDEKNYAPWSSMSVDPSELHYHVRIQPDADRDWDAMLYVVHFWDTANTTAGAALVSTGFQTTDGKIKGTVLKVPGASDTIVMFNSEKSAKLPSPSDPEGTGQFFWNTSVPSLARAAHLFTGLATIGSAITAPGVTTSTNDVKVFIADLVEGVDYTVTVGTASVNSIALSGGLVRATISGAGAGTHNVTVRRNTVDPPPDADSSIHVPTFSSMGDGVDSLPPDLPRGLSPGAIAALVICLGVLPASVAAAAIAWVVIRKRRNEPIIPEKLKSIVTRK